MHQISEIKALVELELKKLSFNGSPRDLYDPIVYMLSLDAKRTRPVLLLGSCEMLGGSISRALMPALGIEIFHNFTLLHDDIMDNAPLRRSNPTVHSKWNSNTAILAGDTMFVKASQLMMLVDDNVLREVMELFHNTAVEVCEGQQADMDFENTDDVSIPDYIAMTASKTAALLAASLKLGAIISGAAAEDANHIYQFGRSIGIAFQLQDDILDAYGDDKKFGKLKGGDIIANKKTYLLLKAFELAAAEEKLALQTLLTVSTNADLKVNGVMKLFDMMNVRSFAEKEMDTYFRDALNHLSAIDVPEERKSVIRGFAEKLMVREI